MKKTKIEEENEKGRLPLWLDPEDIAFLCNEWRRIPENITETERKTWERIAFRGMTCLHKNDMNYIAEFPDKKGRYKLENN